MFCIVSLSNTRLQLRPKLAPCQLLRDPARDPDLLTKLAVRRTVPFVESFFLRHVPALLGVAVPTCTWAVINVRVRVHPHLDRWISFVLARKRARGSTRFRMRRSAS